MRIRYVKRAAVSLDKEMLSARKRPAETQPAESSQEFAMGNG